MPELPDVEIFRRYFDNTSLHQTIDKVEVIAEIILQDISADDLKSQLIGKAFESTKRHGKYLFSKINGSGWLVFHFGMTGYLEYFKGKENQPKYTCIRFDFSNGNTLAFTLRRKLGRLFLVSDINNFMREHGLGYDALDENLDAQTFKKLIKSTTSGIKSALMNQDLISGIGNDYSDEILFQARLYPETKTARISDEGIGNLYKVMKEVLNTAIESGADPDKMPGNFLLPHRKKGEKCPVCGGETAVLKVSGRTSYYCPVCQK